MAIYQGTFHVQTTDRFALVASRFNYRVTQALVEGATDTFIRHGVPAENIDLVWVPGAFELGGVVQKMRQRPYAAIVTLGAIVRGDTPHFEYVAGQTASAIGRLSQDSSLPIIFGVLTCNTMEQAEDRAGGKAGNKGAEAAATALEMANLYRSLGNL